MRASAINACARSAITSGLSPALLIMYIWKPPVLPRPGMDGGFNATTLASGIFLAAKPNTAPTMALTD